jgi:hypothetical protein
MRNRPPMCPGPLTEGCGPLATASCDQCARKRTMTRTWTQVSSLPDPALGKGAAARLRAALPRIRICGENQRHLPQRHHEIAVAICNDDTAGVPGVQSRHVVGRTSLMRAGISSMHGCLYSSPVRCSRHCARPEVRLLWNHLRRGGRLAPVHALARNGRTAQLIRGNGQATTGRRGTILHRLHPHSISRGRRRAEPMAIVADLQTDAAAIDGQVDLHGAGVRVLQRITNALLHITGHRDHGFQRITNADSSGT